MTLEELAAALCAERLGYASTQEAWESCNPSERTCYEGEVRAILKRLREPGSRVLAAGNWMHESEGLKCWQAQIDAILEEK